MIRFAIALVVSLHIPFATTQNPEILPGTERLLFEGNPSVEVVRRVDSFLSRRVEQSVLERQRLWSRDYSSAEAYIGSIDLNRKRFRRYIGVNNERQPFEDLELVATLRTSALVAENEQFSAYVVRWPVFERVEAEGLLLEPKGSVKAQVVVIPDADWTPEMMAGLDDSLPPQSQLARRLAEAGCRVLVPTVIDRKNEWSGNPLVFSTNQTHREFLYRQAFFMGRHLIGYEVEKVLAAVDYFKKRAPEDRGSKSTIGVAGYGEGGLLALYSAAVDQRIDAALVGGYFQQREGVWREPVYRNVYGLLTEFGDAEIAGLIAPRTLIIEACRGPEVTGPPALRDGRTEASGGRLATPPIASVKVEFKRASEHYRKLRLLNKIQLTVNRDGDGAAGSQAALKKFLLSLKNNQTTTTPVPARLKDLRGTFDTTPRMKRQFDQLLDYNQNLLRFSNLRRAQFWSKADPSSVPKWEETTRWYRDYLWREVIGWLPAASLAPNAKTRLIYETQKWKGFEVVTDVWPGVINYGILLVPKNMQKGERRPVVVAQHGYDSRPQEVCNPYEDTKTYHSFGARLADRGFIVYAPQNVYIGGDDYYRPIQRKALALKMTIFAVMVRQHEQVLKWLASLPFVDAKRIGFYGLSYGGASAMFIPAVLEGFALSICSADFNETVWKHVSIDAKYSFMFTMEHEHTYFDFGEKMNYAELAGLIAPRPFMVERGHNDDVGEDEWVAYEYAQVRRLYVQLGIGKRTQIEFFNGQHEINAKGTFEFLSEQLGWPMQ